MKSSGVQNRGSEGKLNRYRFRKPIVLIAIAVFVISMSYWYTAPIDCGGVFGNKTDARIRSSKVRMFLESPERAYTRFTPYAAMSALVYTESKECEKHLPPVEHEDLLLNALDENGWVLEDKVPGQPKCDDEIGTFFRIWSKDKPNYKEVVIVFRGTKGGFEDWVHGNLRWVTRFLPGEDQYERSREKMQAVFDYFEADTGQVTTSKPIRYNVTGHSLGGGLAQNVFYRYPNHFSQVFAFDPSPVTGFADNELSEIKASCKCLQTELDDEARIYRIYETDEILAWLRGPLKLINPPNRHIQEVRFNLDVSHSMSGLAKGMIESSISDSLKSRKRWWTGRSEEGGRNCTSLFNEMLEQSCDITNETDHCPS